MNPRDRRPARFAPVIGMLSLAALPARAEEPRCLAAVVAAIERGDPQAVLGAADAALADPQCPPEAATDIRMARAVALADLARATGGDAWCRAKDAYALLRNLEDPIYGPAARAGFEEAATGCAEAAPAPPVDDGWREGPLVLVATGLGTAALLGGGLLAAGAMMHLSEAKGSSPSSARDYANRQEFASGLYVSGLAAVGVGLTAAAAGWIWEWSTDGSDAADVGLTVGPGGIGVEGRF